MINSFVVNRRAMHDSVRIPSEIVSHFQLHPDWGVDLRPGRWNCKIDCGVSKFGSTSNANTREGMIMAQPKSSNISVECPCCGAHLTIDDTLRKVVSYDAPPPKRSGLDLDHAATLLKEQEARREAIFKQSNEDLKIQSQLLNRKFEAALEKNKDEPIRKPTRDIDLD
jgi:hypothetical protein